MRERRFQVEQGLFLAQGRVKVLRAVLALKKELVRVWRLAGNPQVILRPSRPRATIDPEGVLGFFLAQPSLPLTSQEVQTRGCGP